MARVRLAVAVDEPAERLSVQPFRQSHPKNPAGQRTLSGDHQDAAYAAGLRGEDESFQPGLSAGLSEPVEIDLGFNLGLSAPDAAQVRPRYAGEGIGRFKRLL